MYVEQRGQLPEINSLPLPCEFWELRSGHQIWWQMSLFAKVCHWPHFLCFFNVCFSIGSVLYFTIFVMEIYMSSGCGGVCHSELGSLVQEDCCLKPA